MGRECLSVFLILGKIRIFEKKFQVSQTSDMKKKNDYGLLRKSDDKFLELSQRILSRALRIIALDNNVYHIFKVSSQ